MKRIISFTLILIASGLAILSAQVDFVKVSSSEKMDEVWEKAADENLNVFVDVYATWCGPCKWLDANVFSLEEAGNYLSKSFISVKIDGDSDFGSGFARKNGLQVYPSLFVFNSEKKLMNILVGAQPWEQLEPALQNTIDFFPVLELYQSKYDSELLSRNDYPAYVAALRKLKKDDLAKSVVGYYRDAYIEENKLTGKDINVIAFYVEPGTGEWEMLTKDIKKLRNSLGNNLSEFIEQALEKSIMASVEEYNYEIAEKFNKILPFLAKGTELDIEEMETRSHIYYYHYSSDFDSLIGYIDSVYAGPKKGDHGWLFKAAADAVFLDARNRQMTMKGIEWFTSCIGEKETYDYYFHLGLSQYFSEMVDESLVSFKKAKEFASDDEERENIIGVIKEVESMQ